jgi:acetoin utilization deacetylase AcuC-like enzyme
MERFCRAGGGRIDADTAANSASWDAAVLAAGAGPTCVEALDRGEGDAAFCAVRPPGHHATKTRAMGFCLVNNVAVTAAMLAARGERVLIVDYDAHHGNGTQAVFYDDPRVLYASFHEYPLYPGTGELTETGAGPGEGFTVNFPLPEGTTGEVYLAGIDEVLAPIVERFDPGWLLLSAGFDAHRRDPITEFGPAGRRIALLEGGYDLQALSDSTAAALGALEGVDVRPELPTCGGPGHEVIVAARREWTHEW